MMSLPFRHVMCLLLRSSLSATTATHRIPQKIPSIRSLSLYLVCLKIYYEALSNNQVAFQYIVQIMHYFTIIRNHEMKMNSLQKNRCKHNFLKSSILGGRVCINLFLLIKTRD